jgi:hypothetical protein
MTHTYSYPTYSINWQLGQRLGKENLGNKTTKAHGTKKSTHKVKIHNLFS